MKKNLSFCLTALSAVAAGIILAVCCTSANSGKGEAARTRNSPSWRTASAEVARIRQVMISASPAILRRAERTAWNNYLNSIGANWYRERRQVSHS